LNERLSLPFTRYFYFKPDTPAASLFSARVAARKTVARDIGQYSAYGKEGWNDEVLVGDTLREPENQVEALVADAEIPGPGGEEGEKIERPASRVTEADQKGDQQSLDRALERSLVLVVKNEEGRWMFPSARIVRGETLDQVSSLYLSISIPPPPKRTSN
jgi:large subunit ribosomal protein L46